LPFTLENLWCIPFDAPNLDSWKLQDEEIAIREASFFKRAGGDTIVDLTVNLAKGRDHLGLANVSRTTGLNVIMGSGYYCATIHPADMDSKTEEDICAEIVREVTEGVADTGIRSGIIGEIGCSWPLTHNEEKVLRAAANAQRQTGAPLMIHPGRNASAPLEIIAILSKAGADIGRTIICHIDRTLRQPKDLHKLAETGCYLAYDMCGEEGYYTLSMVDLPNDHQRVNEIMQLINQGYLNQILISQDICTKHRLRRYGGHGYDHILRNMVPVMRLKGMSDEQIRTLLVENPQRLLRFV
jgi:phosphotriesterase-related protein